MITAQRQYRHPTLPSVEHPLGNILVKNYLVDYVFGACPTRYLQAISIKILLTSPCYFFDLWCTYVKLGSREYLEQIG